MAQDAAEHPLSCARFRLLQSQITANTLNDPVLDKLDADAPVMCRLPRPTPTHLSDREYGDRECISSCTDTML